MQCPICGQDCVESQVFCKTCGARLSDEQDGVNTHALPEGTVIGGQYRVGKVISRGGFGITYEGADTKLKRGVAIKEYYHVGSTRIGKTVTPPHTLTPAEHRKAMEQFKEEAELLSKVNHPQIVKVYNYLEENDTGYIILELLEGKSLEEVLRIQGKMGAEEIKGLILPILKGLEAVHKEGILHRDIKPANIILSSRGGVLIDFGASRQYALGKSMDMAQVLTPGYAPLEQYGSRGEFGPPLDIYAIGAMMYRMITGKEPPSAADLATEAVELELGDSRLEQVIRRCMKTNATMRYPDVGSLWKDIAHQATPQPLPSVGVEALSPAKEKPKKKNTAVLISIIMIAFIVVLVNQFIQTSSPVEIISAYIAAWDESSVKKETFTGDEAGIIYVVHFSDWYETHSVYAKWYNPDGSLYHDGESNAFELEGESDGDKWASIGYDFSEKENVREHMKKTAGRWKVEIYLDGAYEKTLYFTIDPNAGKTQQGTVRIESSPTGAEVYVNGSYKGTTPYTLTTNAGNYEVEVRKSGYVTQKRTIRIVSGGSATERFTLTGVQASTPTPSTPSGMVLVNRGSFQMGNVNNDKEGDDDEKPVHTVTLTYDYWMGKYEVTFAEYDVFCNATGRSKPNDEGWGRVTRPVMNVTWWDAIAYCNWLSEKEGIAKAYDSNGNLLDRNGRTTTDITKVQGYRLPTEAEWEYAARGGIRPCVYKYSGSEILGEVGWFLSNSTRKTQPVGEKKANELGIYDMSGNVWEWCHDCYGYYTKEKQKNKIIENRSNLRVQRGGSWYNVERHCCVFKRESGTPASALNNLGFRIARTCY